MKPATKVFATLSLSAAVGKKISLSGETENIRGAGTSLMDAGREAAGRYPSAPLTLSKIVATKEAVESLLSTPMEPQEILSMLMAGLIDIYAECGMERKELIGPVIVCAICCLDFYPDDIDHEKAFLRYQAWSE